MWWENKQCHVQHVEHPVMEISTGKLLWKIMSKHRKRELQLTWSLTLTNNSVKINMYDSGSVVIQGAKCTVFSDAFFHKLKQEYFKSLSVYCTYITRQQPSKILLDNIDIFVSAGSYIINLSRVSRKWVQNKDESRSTKWYLNAWL